LHPHYLLDPAAVAQEHQHLQLEAEAMEVMALLMDAVEAVAGQLKAAATAATAVTEPLEL
jgi:hypothetical protein